MEFSGNGITSLIFPFSSCLQSFQTPVTSFSMGRVMLVTPKYYHNLLDSAQFVLKRKRKRLAPGQDLRLVGG